MWKDTLHSDHNSWQEYNQEQYSLITFQNDS